MNEITKYESHIVDGNLEITKVGEGGALITASIPVDDFNDVIERKGLTEDELADIMFDHAEELDANQERNTELAQKLRALLEQDTEVTFEEITAIPKHMLGHAFTLLANELDEVNEEDVNSLVLANSLVVDGTFTLEEAGYLIASDIVGSYEEEEALVFLTLVNNSFRRTGDEILQAVIKSFRHNFGMSVPEMSTEKVGTVADHADDLLDTVEGDTELEDLRKENEELRAKVEAYKARQRNLERANNELAKRLSTIAQQLETF